MSFDRDQPFSHYTQSSMTSHPAIEVMTAQEEVFRTFSENLELQSLYREAFQVMSIEDFEKQFPKVLKTYCADLSREAINARERQTVHFIQSRSRRHFITRRVCETFGAEDIRVAAFAELNKQREEQLDLLERFFRGQNPVNKADAEESFADSDNEADLDSEDDFGNVELVKDFLLGKAFTIFQKHLRQFIESYANKADSTLPPSFKANEASTDKEETSTQNAPESTKLNSEKTPDVESVTSNNPTSTKTVKIEWQCVSSATT